MATILGSWTIFQLIMEFKLPGLDPSEEGSCCIHGLRQFLLLILRYIYIYVYKYVSSHSFSTINKNEKEKV